jgi:ribosomal-protein-alanine N-acetyltransferase
VETDRLTGQPTSPAHVDCAIEMFGDPAVAEWIWPAGREGMEAGPRSAAQVREILDAQIAHWSSEGFGWWWWRERESGRLVGEAGLQRTTVEGVTVVEVGWTLLPSHWGHGFATEAAGGALRYGFGLAGLDEVVALTLPGNDRSLAVMGRLGMEPRGDVVHTGLPHLMFGLTRDSWNG